MNNGDAVLLQTVVHILIKYRLIERRRRPIRIRAVDQQHVERFFAALNPAESVRIDKPDTLVRCDGGGMRHPRLTYLNDTLVDLDDFDLLDRTVTKRLAGRAAIAAADHSDFSRRLVGRHRDMCNRLVINKAVLRRNLRGAVQHEHSPEPFRIDDANLLIRGLLVMKHRFCLVADLHLKLRQVVPQP
ncbi:hypothetical protein D3C84_778920 [compost metagenome]